MQPRFIFSYIFHHLVLYSLLQVANGVKVILTQIRNNKLNELVTSGRSHRERVDPRER